jgi:putative ATPase
LIGATTENPSFTVNNALLSRCRVFVFEKLNEEEVGSFILAHLDHITDAFPCVEISPEIIHFVAQMGNGDLRNSLNLLESALSLKKIGTLDREDIINAGQNRVYYDRNGDEHYMIISAVHKSLRDSDGDAACYWIQRMLVGGEDPLYIVRRLLRFASEDIGPADNNALLLANQVYDAVAKIGMPECTVFIFQLAIYLAKAKKDNSAYRVALATKADVEQYGNLPVPMHLRNASTKLMKDIGYGE